MQYTKPLAVTAALVTAGLVLTSCSVKSQEPFKDAPKDGRDNRPAKIIEMPDGFSNLATKCVDGVRYTVAYHGDNKYGAISTVIDPACATGGH